MDDLVSREWLLKHLFFEVDRELVRKAPDAQKHGRWIHGECSICHEICIAYNPPFCPYCGNPMDGGVDDE